MKIIGRVIDERFFAHRQQSTSIGGLAGAVLALSLFWYRYYVNHFWSWDLLAVGATIGLVKMAMMTWYYLTD